MYFRQFGRACVILAATTVAVHAQSVNTSSTASHQASAGHSIDAPASADSASWRTGAQITRLNVDSIMRVLPAATVTELLETRVPGLVVSHTSGAPGAPSYLRLRGVSSVMLSNSPLVIVDDIRLADVRSTQGYASLAQVSGVGPSAPSPIDEIDPNIIDHIDVLPGPAAAARYGSDGAHGAIVISTKRGAPGAPQWRVTASGGQASRLTDFPVPLLRWGRGFDGSSPFCAYHDPSCIIDSLPRFQALNDSRYTPFGDGSTGSASLSVSGGTRRLTYALTGSAFGQSGTMHLPDLEAAHYQSTHGFAAPAWMRDPDFYHTWSAFATVGADLGQGLALTLTSRQFGGVQQSSSLDAAIPVMEAAYVDPTTAASTGFLPDYTSHITNDTRAASYSAALEWNAIAWLPLRATVGLDHRQRDDAIRNPPLYNATADTIGYIQSGTAAVQTQTATLGTLVPVGLTHGYSMPTAIGVTLTRQWERLDQLARSYPQTISTSVVHQDAVPFTTIGGYLEPHLQLGSALFVTPGLRLDHDHVAGIPSHTVLYPSLSAAWDVPGVADRFAWMPTTRIHAAYGEAGAQPGPDGRLAFGATLPIQLLATRVSYARPERSRELEGGTALHWLNGRLSADLTIYQKQTSRALVGGTTAVFGGGGLVTPTTADVRNRGLELAAAAELLQRDALAWTVGANISHNGNRVTAVHGFTYVTADDAPEALHVAAGAPLFGRWARAIVGYADTNHDGIISSAEVVVQDSSTLAGSELPPTVLGMTSGLQLFHGQLSIHTSVDYEDGMTILDYAAAIPTIAGTLLQGLASAPGTPFAQQAGALMTPTTMAGAIQSIHVLRWSALSVNYTVPRRFAARMRVPSIVVTAQGNNLAMHTNYRNADPLTTTVVGGTAVADVGQVPTPRVWTLRVTLGS